MHKDLQTISLPLPFHMGKVNCYLIQTEAGYVLVDTGGSNSRKELVRELESAGCKPGLFNLIILTMEILTISEMPLFSIVPLAERSPCTWTMQVWLNAAICS
jgi:hypothetical protein